MKRYVYVGNIKQLCLFWDFQAFATNCLWTLVSKMTLGSYSSGVGNEMFSLLKNRSQKPRRQCQQFWRYRSEIKFKQNVLVCSTLVQIGKDSDRRSWKFYFDLALEAIDVAAAVANEAKSTWPERSIEVLIDSLTTEWPYLTQFWTYFVILRIYLVFGKIFNLLCQYLLLGKV